MKSGQRGGDHSHQQQEEVGSGDLGEADDKQHQHGCLVGVEGEEPPGEADEGEAILMQWQALDDGHGILVHPRRGGRGRAGPVLGSDGSGGGGGGGPLRWGVRSGRDVWVLCVGGHQEIKEQLEGGGVAMDQLM